MLEVRLWEAGEEDCYWRALESIVVQGNQQKPLNESDGPTRLDNRRPAIERKDVTAAALLQLVSDSQSHSQIASRV
jgi:hypothetical protein